MQNTNTAPRFVWFASFSSTENLAMFRETPMDDASDEELLTKTPDSTTLDPSHDWLTGLLDRAKAELLDDLKHAEYGDVLAQVRKARWVVHTLDNGTNWALECADGEVVSLLLIRCHLLD